MIAALRRIRPTLLSMIASAIVLLPPSGWSLCVGTNGHFEIEPVARNEQRCCETEPRNPIPDTCAPDDCASCLDLALSPGPALRTRLHEMATLSIAAVPAVAASLLAPAPRSLAPPGAHRLARTGGARIGTTILRC